jgi:hypothetical protein
MLETSKLLGGNVKLELSLRLAGSNKYYDGPVIIYPGKVV